MKKINDNKNYNKIQKFSIRKYSFGAASVAIASYLMFMGNGAVFAGEATVTENTAAKTEEVVTTGEPKKEEAPKVVGTETAEEKAQKELVASKEKLASYVKKIEGNLSSGKYESKTEESLALLRDAISKANQAANATTKVEVEKAYANLITTVNAKLKAKPVEKKETPAVDTTNGKETVDKKAENTEKKSDSNSIDNTGSKDPRNGKVMDKDNAFRTEATAATHEATTNKVGNISYTMEFSDDTKKEIYLYNQEDTNIDITVNSTAGNISSVKVRGGGNRPLDEATKDSAVQIDGFGWSYKQTLTETPGPVTMNITGKTNERFLGLTPTNRREDQNSVLGDRYLVITDAEGGSVSASSNGVNQPGYFKLVVKSQTYKYSIQQPEIDGDKIGVDDINNLTTSDIEKIKNQINIEYSKTSTDERLSSKKGTALENKSDVVKNIEVSGGNITVTYKDDSTDTATISSVVRNNVAPTVSIPYSDPTPNKKEIYLYTGEEADVDITFNDDSGKIESAALKKGGNIALNNVGGNPDIQDNEWGFTVTAINSETATPAKIKITGQVSGIAQDRLPKTENDSLELVTRFATATDKDGKYIINNAVKNKNNGEVVGTYLTDPGAVTFVLKAQAKKYDMVKPSEEDKVAVADPTAVTDEEFAKIKAQLEYSRTNEDKNLESKRGEKVDNTDNKIATITKEGNNIVATYKDGSKDVRPLSDFTKLDKQPAIDAVNTAATEKIAAINATPNATDEEKAAAIARVNADKEKALTAINDATAKDALDTAKESGTTAIAADNPVVAKKDEAKKAIEAALTAKNNVIDGRDDLTPAQKTAAKEKAAEEAKKAKEAVDAATTDAAVDQVKTAGETAVAAVTPVAKEPAKQAIAKALEDKNAELEKRTDLTDEEKAKAKEEAKNLADAQLAEIDKQPDAAATPEAAQTAQTAVDAAKTKGVADVTAVNPVAAKKPAAKKAIEDALTAKNNAIDGRTDLTPEEKQAAKDKAAEEAKNAKEAIDAATTDAAVDQAKTAGETAVAAVTPVAKEPAKQAIAKALEDKNAEIEKRTDLTDEEKAKAKEEAKKLADAQLAEIAKQPDVAETPEAAQTAQTAVDAAKKTGVDDVTAVNPEAVTKPAAKKAIDDKLAEQLKTIENTPDATEDEKKVAAEQAKTLAELAKKEIDNKTTDADVNQFTDTEKAEIEKVLPVVEDKPNARKAIDEEAKAKKEAIEARTDLTPKAKEDLKAEVDKLAKEAKKAVDNATTTDEVNGVEEAGKTAIQSVGAVNIPANKVLVNDPSALTDEEKAKVLEAVKKVNPDAKEITQDADGNVTVTTPDGHKEIITPEQVVKTSDTANEPKAGNDVVKPADKVVVADPTKLTDAEKEKIKAAVKAVNPNSVVTVDEKGNAKVSTQDGQTQVIPVDELVRTAEDTKKPNAGNDIVKPADKTVVANPDALTPEEKKAIEDKVKAVNPGATVVVDDKGNATVTKGDGTVLNIPALDLVIPAENLTDAAKNTAIKTPAFRTLVGSKEQLTDSEKESVKKAIEAVNPGATVVVDDKGNATVTLPDGSTATISKEQLVKDKEDAKAKNGGDNLEFDFSKVTVADLKNITPEEKVNFQIMILGAITDVEEFDISTLVKTTDAEGNTVYTSKDGKVKITIDKDGNATIEKDGKKELAISIDKAGNVTIVTKDGKVLAIPRDDAFKQRSYVPQYDNTASKVDKSKVDKSKLELGIRNLDSLIASQLDQLDAAKAKEAKALLAEAKEVFGNPNATQAEVDAMVKRLEEFKLNQASVATDDQTANNAANASNGETSADVAEEKLAANVSNRNKQKELPNTGTSTFGTVLPAIAALLSGVGVFATKKKEDE